MTQELDEKMLERMRKLLALASNNDNEHQAAAAMEKLNDMLLAYNLEMADLGKSGKGAQRSDTKKSGGLYGWQRKLWQSVAELNFCFYFSIKGLAKGSVYERRLVGSHANVIATEVMAKYLQETVEKLAQQWAKEEGHKSVFVREAIAYREGMTARIGERLSQRRREQLAEARAAEEERKRNEARDNTAPSGNALSIVDVVSSEADFNNDYLNGWEMGETARRRAQQEAKTKAWMAENAEKQRKWDEWAAKNPEEAARKLAEAAAENKAWYEKYQFKASRAASRSRRLTPEEERAGLGSYHQGRAKGNDVGIDQQVRRTDTARIG